MSIVAFILAMLLPLIGGKAESATVMVIPPMPQHAPRYVRDTGNDELEWFIYNLEAQRDYADEFTALFNSYEVKRAKNGALMIRQGNSGSYRFAKKGM
jgi:hypothetical protein